MTALKTREREREKFLACIYYSWSLHRKDSGTLYELLLGLLKAGWGADVHL